MAAILIPIFLCLYLPFRYLTRQEWPLLRRALYFPIAGSMRWERARWGARRQALLQRLRGVELVLRTDDDRNVHAVWIEHPGAGGAEEAQEVSGDQPITTPCVLLLHANAMVLDDMLEWANFYYQLGCSVMLVTFWGYPDPNDDGGESQRHGADGEEMSSLLGPQSERCPTERGMYLDAEAALRYIQQVRACGRANEQGMFVLPTAPAWRSAPPLVPPADAETPLRLCSTFARTGSARARRAHARPRPIDRRRVRGLARRAASWLARDV